MVVTASADSEPCDLAIDDFHSYFTKCVLDYGNGRRYCDADISNGGGGGSGGPIASPIHIAVLASCSPLLRDVIADAMTVSRSLSEPSSASKDGGMVDQPIIVLVPDFDLQSVLGFVSFVYTGRVNASADVCSGIVELCTALCVSFLEQVDFVDPSEPEPPPKESSSNKTHNGTSNDNIPVIDLEARDKRRRANIPVIELGGGGSGKTTSNLAADADDNVAVIEIGSGASGSTVLATMAENDHRDAVRRTATAGGGRKRPLEAVTLAMECDELGTYPDSDADDNNDDMSSAAIDVIDLETEHSRVPSNAVASGAIATRTNLSGGRTFRPIAPRPPHVQGQGTSTNPPVSTATKVSQPRPQLPPTLTVCLACNGSSQNVALVKNHACRRKCAGCSRDFMSVGTLIKHESVCVKSVTTTSECPRCQTKMSRNRLASHLLCVQSSRNSNQCPRCCIRFCNEHLLNQHHCSTKSKLSCKYCGAFESTVSRLRGHERKCLLYLSFVTDGGLNCELCATSFSSIDQYQTHVMYPKCCMTCLQTFCTSSLLEQHRCPIYGSYTCEKCRAPFCHEGYLAKHQQLCCVVSLNCTHCKSTFKSGYELSQHADALNSPDNPNQCSFCDRRFCSSIQQLWHACRKSTLCAFCDTRVSVLLDEGGEVHIRTCKENKSKQPCVICGEKFRSVLHFEQHVIRQRQHRCSKCHVAFCKAPLLSSHTCWAGATLKCKYCYSEAIPNVIALRNHEELCWKSKDTINALNGACRTCQTSFESVAQLQGHLTVLYSGGHQNRCDKCFDIFCNSQALQLHKAKECLVTFACEHCKVAKFSSLSALCSLSALRSHQRDCCRTSITVGKLNMCRLCKQPVASEAEADVHRQESNRNQCAVCKTRFCNRSLLDAHIPKCPKSSVARTPSADSLTQSVQSALGESYKDKAARLTCANCNSVFTSEAAHSEHLNARHQRTKCHKCQRFICIRFASKRCNCLKTHTASAAKVYQYGQLTSSSRLADLARKATSNQSNSTLIDLAIEEGDVDDPDVAEVVLSDDENTAEQPSTVRSAFIVSLVSIPQQIRVPSEINLSAYLDVAQCIKAKSSSTVGGGQSDSSTNVGPPKCAFCNARFDSYVAYCNHVLEVTDVKQCMKCSLLLCTRKDFPSRLSALCVCTDKFSTVEQMMETVHDLSYNANAASQTKSSISKNISEHLNVENSFQKRRGTLSNSSNENQSTSDDKIQCLICYKQCDSVATFARHMLLETDKKACDKCNKLVCCGDLSKRCVCAIVQPQTSTAADRLKNLSNSSVPRNQFGKRKRTGDKRNGGGERDPLDVKRRKSVVPQSDDDGDQRSDGGNASSGEDEQPAPKVPSPRKAKQKPISYRFDYDTDAEKSDISNSEDDADHVPGGKGSSSDSPSPSSDSDSDAPSRKKRRRRQPPVRATELSPRPALAPTQAPAHPRPSNVSLLGGSTDFSLTRKVPDVAPTPELIAKRHRHALKYFRIIEPLISARAGKVKSYEIPNIREFLEDLSNEASTCEFCQKDLPDNYKLRRHLSDNHVKLDCRIFRCPACPNQSYISKQPGLKTHLQRDHSFDASKIEDVLSTVEAQLERFTNAAYASSEFPRYERISDNNDGGDEPNLGSPFNAYDGQKSLTGGKASRPEIAERPKLELDGKKSLTENKVERRVKLEPTDEVKGRIAKAVDEFHEVKSLMLRSLKEKRNVLPSEIPNYYQLLEDLSIPGSGFKCCLCGGGNSNRSHLRYHIAAVHFKVDTRPYKCTFCDAKPLASRSGLQSHYEQHHALEVSAIEVTVILDSIENPFSAPGIERQESMTPSENEGDADYESDPLSAELQNNANQFRNSDPSGEPKVRNILANNVDQTAFKCTLCNTTPFKSLLGSDGLQGHFVDKHLNEITPEEANVILNTFKDSSNGQSSSERTSGAPRAMRPRRSGISGADAKKLAAAEKSKELKKALAEFRLIEPALETLSEKRRPNDVPNLMKTVDGLIDGLNCGVCERNFFVLHSVREHVAAVHLMVETAPFTCSRCDNRKYRTKAGLKEHLTSTHATEMTPADINKLLSALDAELKKPPEKENRLSVAALTPSTPEKEKPETVKSSVVSEKPKLSSLLRGIRLKKGDSAAAVAPSPPKKPDLATGGVEGFHRCDNCDFVAGEQETLDLHVKDAHPLADLDGDFDAQMYAEFFGSDDTSSPLMMAVAVNDESTSDAAAAVTADEHVEESNELMSLLSSSFLL